MRHRPSQQSVGSGRDPLERAFEVALQPGQFISDWDCSEFVADLEDVVAQVVDCIPADPLRAVGLLETFFAGCHLKEEEVDDSSGGMGNFAASILCHWIAARQAAETDPLETIQRFLEFMDRDEYGFCHEIEKEAVKVFHAAELDAFAAAIEQRFQASERRHIYAGMLRTIALERNDLEGYTRIVAASELTSNDCLAFALIHQAKQQPDEALSWCKKGIGLCQQTGRQHDDSKLRELQRQILTYLGRHEEVLVCAWQQFVRSPNVFAYDTLMQSAPESQRVLWHTKALDAATQSGTQYSLALFLKTDEMERAVQTITDASDEEIRSICSFELEPLAERLTSAHPNQAARLWIIPALEILSEKRSREYRRAAKYLAKAKRCLEHAGRHHEWQSLAQNLLQEHRRKTSFTSALQDAIQGRTKPPEPTFLEKAKMH